MSETIARLGAKDTDVRVDILDADSCNLVVYEMGKDAVVFRGSISSILMLVDRINDRLYDLRERTNQ